MNWSLIEIGHANGVSMKKHKIERVFVTAHLKWPFDLHEWKPELNILIRLNWFSNCCSKNIKFDLFACLNSNEGEKPEWLFF